MAMCTPTGYSGWTYTQKKHNALTVTGTLEINQRAVSLSTTHVLAMTFLLDT
ncbi:DUF2804 domain-containing protein [Vibrio chagasii]|nr:DUF2804 domain-containing protein [Vibrio chagasii]